MSSRSNGNGLVLGGEPRVDLLPPEVHQKAKDARSRRVLGLLVIVAVVIVAAGYVGAALVALGAQTALDAANRQTVTLQAERAKYKAASAISDQVVAIAAAQKTGTSTEVLWGDLYKSIGALLPSGVSIQSGTFSSRAPWEPELTQAGPLRRPHVATLGLVLESAGVNPASAAVANLATLPSFADVTVDSVDSSSRNAKTSVTLDVTDAALSARFAKPTGAGN